MDSRTPDGEAPAGTRESERVALRVLALCFVLALLGRGLSDSFTVFLKADLREFRLGSRAGDLGLFADLAGRRADGAGDRPVLRPLRPAHRVFARAAPARRRVPGSLVGAGIV